MICPACAAAIDAASVDKIQRDLKAKILATLDTMTKDGQGLSRSQVDTIMAAIKS